MEIANGAILGGDGHGGEVVGVADGLEVAADDEEVDGGPFVDTAGLGDGGVDGVEGAVALWRGGVSRRIGVGTRRGGRSLQLRCAWQVAKLGES